MRSQRIMKWVKWCLANPRRGALILGATAMILIALADATYAAADKKKVPELAPGATGSALTLLAGSAILLRRQFRPRSPAGRNLYSQPTTPTAE